MTLARREQLIELMKVKDSKKNDKKKKQTRFLLSMKMPHEKSVEIGERILKEKFLTQK